MPVSAPFASPFGSPFGPPFAHPLQSGGVTDVLIAAQAGADGVCKLQVKGEGTAEQPHSADIYQGPNHEGFYDKYKENETLQRDGRGVGLLALYNEDFTKFEWMQNSVTKIGNTVIDGVACMEVLTTAVGYSGLRTVPPDLPVTSDVICTAKVRAADGEIARFKFRKGPTYSSHNIAVGDTWIIITGTVSEITSATCYIIETNPTVKTFYIAWMDIEDPADRVDKSTPSEHFQTGATSVQKVFSRTNGNSVIDHVVTYGDGTLLNPPPSVVNLPLFANRCKNGTQESAQIATLLDTGKVTLNVFGAGATATIAAGTAVGTGWGTANTGTPIELDITTAGTVTITATGSPEAINLLEDELEIGRLSGPIYTSGTEVATDAAQAVYDADNLDNDTGVLFVKIDPGEISQLCVEKAIAYGLGPEFVGNGRFNANINGWSTGNGTVAHVDNSLELTNITTYNTARYDTPFNLVAGNTYIIKLKVTSATSLSRKIYLGSTLGAADILNSSTFSEHQGETVEILFIATSTQSTYFSARGSSSVGDVVKFDDVSIRQLDANTAFSLVDPEGNHTSIAGAAGLNSIAVIPDGLNNEMHLYVGGSWSAATTYCGTLIDQAVMEMLKYGYYQALRCGKGGSVAQRKAWAERHAV